MAENASASPPSYESVTGTSNRSGVEIISSEEVVGLITTDIIPECLDPGGWMRFAVYEDFPTVVRRANNWLIQNPRLELRTCETVEHLVGDSHGESIDINASAFRTSGEGSNAYVRGLRLWLQPRAHSEFSSLQQIAFLDILPRIEPGFFKDDVLDRLDALIQHTNQQLTSVPLPGKVITIETDTLQIGTDTLATFWIEHSGSNPQFVYRLRIFYLLGPPAYETIGVADFIPRMLNNPGIFERPIYEPFPAVLAKAHQWVTAQPNSLSLRNIQTLFYKHNTPNVDTQKMSYNEGNLKMYFVRYLRLTFVIKNPVRADDHFFGGNTEEPVKLNCKSFIPGLIKEPECCEPAIFESQLEVQARINEWIRGTGAKMISVETLPMRVFCGAEQLDGYNTMYTWNSTSARRTGNNTHRRKDAQQFLIIYRVYIDGNYAEPPGTREVRSVEEYMQQNSSNCNIL